MAYETGSATDITDLVDKLRIFVSGLSTTPWTIDEYSAASEKATFHLDDCYVSFRWDDTVEEQLAMYQSLGWTSSSTPDQFLDDSGNGTTVVPITLGRRVNFESSGPYATYYFFAGEGRNPYIHVVV